MKEDKPKEPLTKAPASAEAEADKKIEELEKQKNEYLEGWKKERASFLNYKKEEMERIMELMKYANEGLVLKILPILDNFELAFKNVPEDLKKDEHIKGLLQIYQQLKDFLKSQGIEEIKAVGEKFDPNFHEVVGEIETESIKGQIESIKGQTFDKSDSDKSAGEEGRKEEKGKESGVVVEEIQKGYTMNGKVIRPARVKISK